MFFSKKKSTPKPQFQNSIQLGIHEFKITVKYSKKKNSSVTVDKKEIIFRFPENLSNKLLENHFNELLKKIVIKIQNSPQSHLNSETQVEFNQIYELGKFKFHNEIFTIEKSNLQGIKLNKQTNHFRVNQNLSIENIEKQIIKKLIDKYTPILFEHLSKLNEFTYKYPIKDFHISLVKSKWGHCTGDNKIMLNLKLLNADIDVLNYVIFHEISHIKVKNHSPRFWAEVERFCPNHKQLRKRLKNNPPQLYQLVQNE